jgi:hypothetical protein
MTMWRSGSAVAMVVRAAAIIGGSEVAVATAVVGGVAVAVGVAVGVGGGACRSAVGVAISNSATAVVIGVSVAVGRFAAAVGTGGAAGAVGVSAIAVAPCARPSRHAVAKVSWNSPRSLCSRVRFGAALGAFSAAGTASPRREACISTGAGRRSRAAASVARDAIAIRYPTTPPTIIKARPRSATRLGRRAIVSFRQRMHRPSGPQASEWGAQRTGTLSSKTPAVPSPSRATHSTYPVPPRAARLVR